MAKVSEIKFDVKGVSYKVNVNCTSNGQFNANIPKNVADALRISDKITASTLAELTKTFDEKLEHYKTIETTETLHILIMYRARGKYIEKKDGSFNFGHNDSLYSLNVSFSEIDNALGFDFIVAIKQTIDGKDKWFRAKLGKDCSHIQKEYNEPNIYHKMQEVYNHKLKNYKVIPFNEMALETLKIAEEKLRAASEMLYNFIKQDEEQILLTLTNQKLLS